MPTTLRSPIRLDRGLWIATLLCALAGCGRVGSTTAETAATKATANCGTGAPLPAAYDPECTDVAPDTKHSCAEQAGWGKCGEPWMQGFCQQSCGVCAGPPPAWPACGACEASFMSGINLAWIDFGRDLPNPDLAAMSAAFKDVVAAGGPFVRWWMHVNGAVTPGYDASGTTLPLADAHVTGLVKLLNQAKADGALVVVTLWSFDMLQRGQSHPNGEAEDLAANKALLTDDTKRQAYIDNYLTPLVRAVKGHPALHSFDLINEPEGMSDAYGWTPDRVAMADIQRTVNWLADAIHKEWPAARVSVGSWSFKASSDIGGFTNHYSDATLLVAGGRALGTLDYYQVHHYVHLGDAVSPFTHAASHWELDKPVVIGEFWPDDSHGLALDSLYVKLHDAGYAGAWAWQYQHVDETGDGARVDNRWPAARPAMAALSAAQPTAVAVACQ